MAEPPKTNLTTVGAIRAAAYRICQAAYAVEPVSYQDAANLHNGICRALPHLANWPTEGDFGWALAKLRAGHKVRRKSWAVDEWIWFDDKLGTLRNEDGTDTRFLDNQPLLARDWLVAP